MRGAPYSLRYTRGGVVRVGVGRGRHTLVVGSGDRVAEQSIEVASFQPRSLVIDLGSREHLVFVGCPPAVEPYLHGDVPAAARALERDGHDAVAQRLLARVARERGQLAAAAEHFEAAGQPLRSRRAARRSSSSGSRPRGSTTARASSSARPRCSRRRASTCAPAIRFQRAGRHDEAADSYREAGDVPRWVEALEKSGRPFEAAQVAIERERLGARDPQPPAGDARATPSTWTRRGCWSRPTSARATSTSPRARSKR